MELLEDCGVFKNSCLSPSLLPKAKFQKGLFLCYLQNKNLLNRMKSAFHGVSIPVPFCQAVLTWWLVIICQSLPTAFFLPSDSLQFNLSSLTCRKTSLNTGPTVSFLAQEYSLVLFINSLMTPKFLILILKALTTQWRLVNLAWKSKIEKYE